MKCQNCQTDNPEGARFCMSCGTPFAQYCSNCQAELPAQARFCMSCGTPVAGAAPPPPPVVPAPPPATPSPPPARKNTGERRVVTIMFADISGFTAMSEKLDPEQVRSLMNACFDQLVPLVEKYGGVVDKFIGDEIMALFGAPVAHEDDPARAMRTALEMQATLRKFNAEHDTTLGMHVGINTGLVVSGGIGSQGRQQYSVMGDAVNLAARLVSAAETDEIFVGPDSYRHAAPLFEFEALEPIKVKGKAEPVQVYRLGASKEQPGRVRGLAGLTSPMVGRDTEFQTLLQLSRDTQNGQGRVALIAGEAGLGKSRLLAEWRAAAPELQWYEGRCLSYGQGLAYHLLIDLIRAFIGTPATAESDETRTALQVFTGNLFGDEAITVYPYLGHLLALPLEGEALDRVSQLDPQALQGRYLNALEQVLRATAARQPLGIVLEDIHWADPSSTNMLLKLLSLTAELPLLFCLLSRPESAVPGWKLAEHILKMPAASRAEVNLHALTEQDSHQLISNLLEIEALPENVRAVILKKSEGNPFFVEEVIRMLVDRQAIIQQDGRWVSQQETIEGIDIPDNLQGLLLARIDRLPDDVKHTLRVASVIGRQFSARVLGEVLEGG